MSLNEQQLEARKSGLGGSDMATVLGINPFKTAYQLFFEKTGQWSEDIGGDDPERPAFWGNVFEDAIATGYETRTQRKVRRKNTTLRHKMHDFIIGHVDRIVTGDNRGLEIKNVSLHMSPKWGPDRSDKVADYYVPQCATYMMLTGYPVWDVAAVFGGNDLRIYTLERDKELEEMIIDAAHNFWTNHVLKNIAPEMDYSHPSSSEFLSKVHSGVSGHKIQLGENLYHYQKVLEEAKFDMKGLSILIEQCENRIKKAMGDYFLGIFPDGTGYRRKVVNRGGYTVEPTKYIDFRYTKKPLETK